MSTRTQLGLTLSTVIFLIFLDLTLAPYVFDLADFERERSDLGLFLELSLFFACLAIFLLFVVPIFTTTNDGRAEVALRMRRYLKTILVKKGSKVIEPSGDIVDLEPEEEPPTSLSGNLFGGLWLVGFWPIDSLLEHDSRYGVIVDGKIDYKTARGTETLVVDQIEALAVLKAEDEDLIPLDVLLTLTILKVNVRKALLGVSDWREAINKRISTYVRGFIAKKSYEEHKEADLERDVLAAISATGPAPGNTPSVIAEFEDRYGIRIRKIEVIDINPDEKLRAITIQRRVGKMNTQQALAETTERIGATIDQLTAKGVTPDKAFDYAQEQTKLDRKGYTKKEDIIRIGNIDGTPLANQNTASIIGTVAAAANKIGDAITNALGAKGGGNTGGGSNPGSSGGSGGGNPSGGSGGGGKTEEERRREHEEWMKRMEGNK